jgi:hypothetical protein
VNLSQFSAAIWFTNLTQSRLEGSLKRSSTTPRCSAQREFLYPYTYMEICSELAKYESCIIEGSANPLKRKLDELQQIL